jgi:hypothetical protein
MDIDLVLKQYDLKYEDLNAVERETFHKMLSSMQESTLTVANLKDYIVSMKESVEHELTKFDLGSKQDLFLKARLRNYMLLEAFLTTPEKAKKALHESLSRLKK